MAAPLGTTTAGFHMLDALPVIHTKEDLQSKSYLMIVQS